MRKRKKRAKKGEPQTITKAVTHIRLEATNAGKLTALDAVASVYLELTQQYTTLFCTDELPNGFRAPCFLTPLSERWHRNAIQQADGTLEEGAKEPAWREWNVPTLRQPCIQANGNVVKLEDATDSTFDYWLKLSTLDKGHPLLIPVRLSDYHKERLTDPETGKRRKINSSMTLNKRDEVWWLTLTYDETILVQTEPDATVIGIDVGIANFITTSDGKQYGTFNGKLRERQKRDREKRRRKAKLRKCLTRQAYVEFDLEEMMDGEVYADFVLLWLLCHQSRVEAERPEACSTPSARWPSSMIDARAAP